MQGLRIRCSLRSGSLATPRVTKDVGFKAPAVGGFRAWRATKAASASGNLKLLPPRVWSRTAVAGNALTLGRGALAPNGINRTSEGRRKYVVRTASGGAEPTADSKGSKDSEDSLDEGEEDESEDDEELEEEPPGTKAGPSGFIVRTVFGLILGAIGALVINCGGFYFAGAMSMVAYQLVSEYYVLVTSMQRTKGQLKAPPLPLRNTSALCSLGIVLGTQYGIRTGLFELSTFAMLFMLVVLRREKKRIRFTQITSLVFGLFYCGYLPSFWVRVRAIELPATMNMAGFATGLGINLPPVTVEAGLLCTVLPVLCIVAADTFAYLGGRTFGKTPLIAISPKKTVEGLLCGGVGAVLTPVIFNYLVGWPGSYVGAVVLGLITFSSSVFGDLIESSMKREAEMKDSGTLIPGHGGLLDRFDSYLLTGVLVYFFWYWFYWFKGMPLVQLRPMMPSLVY
uniref:Phosphatidate cytidylyltransferase n=1 Tax=Pyramimonas obovata TaxID=1411642 RepID=A0A7S0RRY3_9CHLO|mmetsp:Transcript_4830/g.9851  ORF Transcript_4830/g.9851 Transcript_4830/m.9851 type:complete len:454 (+) Transcript_4830:266-1627(+)